MKSSVTWCSGGQFGAIKFQPVVVMVRSFAIRSLVVLWTLSAHSATANSCTAISWKPLQNSGNFGFGKLSVETTETRRECMYACEARGASCGAFIFRHEETPLRCQLLTNISLPLTGSDLVIPAHGSVMVRDREQTLRVLVFRASSGTGSKVYDLYRSAAVSGYGRFPAAHDLSSPLSQPFKHPVLERQPWVIQQMTVQVWNSGSVAAELAFNATGAEKLSWFKLGRLRTSSWTDLTSSSSVSSSGIRANEQRSFWISKYGGNCQDGGWLAVIDGRDYCGWGWFGSYPQFLYSGQDYGIPWTNTGTRRADDFVLLADIAL